MQIRAKNISLLVLLVCALVAIPAYADDPAEKPPSEAGDVTRSDQQTLVFAYWNNATPPFAFIRDGGLTGGIIHDIGQELARRLGVEAVYQLVPTKRIERALQAGDIDLDCVTSPIWKQSPDRYSWSPALFDGADRFLLHQGSGVVIGALADLKGLRVGVYSDYVYRKEITRMFDSGVSQRVIVNDIDHGIRLLLADRIDAMIDFGILLRYKVRQNGLADKVSLADYPADEFKLMCAYSPKLAIPRTRLDQQIQSMVDDNTMAAILARYR